MEEAKTVIFKLKNALANVLSDKRKIEADCDDLQNRINELIKEKDDLFLTFCNHKQSSHYYQSTLFRLIHEMNLYSIHHGCSQDKAEKFEYIYKIKDDPFHYAEIPQLFEDLHLTTLVSI